MKEVIRYTVVFIALCAGLDTQGQCALTFDVSIADTSTTSIQIEVSNLVDDDLGGPQGLCAVQLHFRHSYVGDLTIELISPAGQSVMLVGPVTDQINPTNLTTWEVQFIPCGFPASPDPGFADQWDNEQPWDILATYTGSYYPALGCLENFNTGSANGVWELVLTDADAPQTGTFLGLTLIFCNGAGLECNVCGADAGNLGSDPQEICQGSSLSLDPVYPDTIPDPVLFDYAYLIADSMGGQSLVSQPETAVMAPGLYTICGLSFAADDANGLLAHLDSLSFSEILNAFGAGDIPYCADLTTTCLTLQITPGIDTTFLAEHICSGESVVIGGQELTTPGVHVIPIAVNGPCDSVVVLDLDVTFVEVMITQEEIISCAMPETILDGSGSIAGPGAGYTWTTLDGMILGPTDQPATLISGAGNYTLTIIYNGCEAALTYSVLGDGSIPFISAQSGTITCKDPNVRIHTVVFPSDVDIQWNGPNGFISDSLSPLVSEAGLYYVLVTEPGGCAASAVVEVTVDTFAVPTFIDKAIIDCENQRTLLIAGPGDLIYQDKFSWTGPGGFTSSSSNFWAVDPGMYCVTLTPSNGCSSSACVAVQSDYAIPDILVTPETDTLHCGGSVDLLAQSTTPGSAFSWIGPAGNFSSQPNVNVVSEGPYIAIVTAPNNCTNRDTAEVVNGPDVFLAEAFTDTLSCFHDTATIGVLTFEPAVQYLWEGPGLLDTFSALVRVTQTGIYQVTVSNGGCTQVLTVGVAGDFIEPNFTPFSDTISCDHPVAELSALITSPFTDILWTLPDGSTSHDSILFSTQFGEHALTLTRSNGCMRTRYAYVLADTMAPQVFLESDVLGCDSVRISVLATDSISSYQWSGPGGFETQEAEPFISEGGVYLLEVIGRNGCQASAALLVDINQGVPAVSLDAEELDCLDSMAVLRMTSADSALTFLWTDGNGNMLSDSSQLVVHQPGVYFATATGLNQCIFQDSILILAPELPEIEAMTDTLTCLEPVTLEASVTPPDADLIWTSPSGMISHGTSVVLMEGGDVWLEAVALNGCRTDTMLVIGVDTLAPGVVVASDTVALCLERTVTLDASASTGRMLSYLWTTSNGIIDSGSMSATPTITGEGAYIVSVTDMVNGCSNTDTVIVVEGDVSHGLITMQIVPECDGNQNGSISIDSIPGSSGGLTYFLNGVPGGPVFEGLAMGGYLVTVSDSLGCQTDSLVTIGSTSTQSSVSLGPDRVIQIGDTALLTATLSLPPDQVSLIEWLQPMNCDTCLSNVVMPLETTDYGILVEDIFGCLARDEVRVFVEEKAQFFIPNAFSPNGDNINDDLRIFLQPGIERVVRYSIFDRWGDVVYDEQDFTDASTQGIWDGTAEGRDCNPGVFVYLIELKLITGRTEFFTGTITLLK